MVLSIVLIMVLVIFKVLGHESFKDANQGADHVMFNDTVEIA